ncbi:MAG: hypothetical protein MJ070_01520 [Lachnospiraceae bacterium]|nr:hypothetical protein [Lachnospiraceae bacterium]
MSVLFTKYAELKKKVGGNREMFGYEETFGMPREEQEHITPPARHLVRILAETEFAIRLSASLDGKYDALIGSELDYLTAEMEAEGTLTKSVCEKAEEMLLPMSAEAKEYKLILAGHAHIDMNWMWSWPETVASTIATFTTMLNIMDEYPEFCFSQSQTSVYQIIDEYAPELHDRIKARIDEGRWEVTSSAWVETDKNMPNTESLLRHIAYSKKYLNEKWGIPADKLEIDFSPDTFGHSANLPEIDLFGGVKYYYHCRSLSGDQALYRWRGQSGKEMLVYREQYWYNSGITPKPAMGLIDVSKRCAGLKTGLVVYGVGDHGGGPTRRDVERGIEMMGWPVYPTIRFGTFREFFKEAESVREKLPLVDHELNFIFPGCYTTQSRIKNGNRRCEAALNEAETAMALAHLYAGGQVRGEAIEKAWQKVLFTHFHDILTGSCVQDSREHAMGLFQDAMATANSETSLALGKLAAATDTSMIKVVSDPASQSEGAGAGYHIGSFQSRAEDERGQGLTRIWTVFNDTPADKNEPAEITVWDWTGDMRYLAVTDDKGNPLEFQLLDGGLQHYWDHKFFRVLVYLNVPALSYAAVVLKQGEYGDYPVYLQGTHRTAGTDHDQVLENDKMRFVFSGSTGEMLSATEKATGKELLSAPATVKLIDTNRHNSDAWNIGSYLEKIPLTNVVNVRGICHGELRKGFAFDAKIRSSRVTVEYTLDKGASAVKCHIRADWNEVGGEKVPVLAYEFPTAAKTDRFSYNIPAGSIVREAADQDRPGLSYVSAFTGEDNVPAIVTASKYGFRATADKATGNASLISTLINTAVSPDPYPERGIHEIDLWIGLIPSSPVAAELTARSLSRPMAPVSTGSHKGTLPATGTLLNYSCDTGILSAVIPEENGLTVRFYSVCGKDGTITVDTGKTVKDAYLTNLIGNRLAPCAAEGTKVTAPLAAHTVAQITVTF